MKKNTYPGKNDMEKWAVIENVIEINGKKTPHKEEAGFRFQLKQLEFWRSQFEAKYGHKVELIYSEVK